MFRRRLYPLYQIGNPQLRIFRPPFSLTLVRPGKEQPQDTVQFRIPMEMTKCDVRNYLEKLYNVPVGAVRTRIQYCTNKKRNHLNQKVKRPDYKVAYVQLVSYTHSLRFLLLCAAGVKHDFRSPVIAQQFYMQSRLNRFDGHDLKRATMQLFYWFSNQLYFIVQ
uniref:Large ribosomal subunit protein uL23m n=1 Tax=Hucho hucho TaxID=62062 RepID=A0A4W5MPJ8_9TELE